MRRLATGTIGCVSGHLSIPDTLTHTPSDRDERETILAFLQKYRDAVLLKLDGLDREQLTRTVLPAPSRTTLLGLVKHLTDTEEWWIGTVLGGLPEPPRDDADPDADWLVAADDDPAALVTRYREVCARSDGIVRAQASLDARVTGPHAAGRSARWVILHMLEESARHAGHADIVRELIDGRTGE